MNNPHINSNNNNNNNNNNSSVNGGISLNTNFTQNNNNSNNSNGNNSDNKQIFDEKKRKLTLNLDNSNETSTLNTPQLNINLNLTNKRLKTLQTPLTLLSQTSISTPATSSGLFNIDTPTLLSENIPTPMLNKLVSDFINGTGAMTPSTVVAFPLQTPQQPQASQQRFGGISTPKTESDVAICFQQALEDVRRKDLNTNLINSTTSTQNSNSSSLTTTSINSNNTQNNGNSLEGGNYINLTNTSSANANNSNLINTNSSVTYAPLTTVPSNLCINLSSNPGNILIMQPLNQQQHQLQQYLLNNNINNNNNNNSNVSTLNSNNGNLLIKEEPQTVPVHNAITGQLKQGSTTTATSSASTAATTTTINQNTKTTTAARRTRKTSAQNSHQSRVLSTTSTISSASSSPSRTETPLSSNQDGINISPINLEEQEAIKVEKKRERNRLAAQKCRTRKLEKIATLEIQVKELNDKNAKITGESNLLRQEIMELKARLQQHKIQHGCEIPQSNV